jgi:predicted transcriptional regulator
MLMCICFSYKIYQKTAIELAKSSHIFYQLSINEQNTKLNMSKQKRAILIMSYLCCNIAVVTNQSNEKCVAERERERKSE